MALMRVDAGNVKLYHFRASPYAALSINTIVGIQNFATANKIDIQDSFMDVTAGGTTSGTGGIGFNDQGSATFISKNNIIKGQGGGGAAYTGTASSKFLSEGGNQLGLMSPNAGGLLSLHPTDDLSAATGVTPTCTVTGAGATGTCALVAGSTNEKGTIRISAAGAAPAATGTVTLSFVGTFQFTATPTCTFNYANTGTGTWSLTVTTPIVLTTRSSTAPVLNWNQTAVALTAGSTYDIDYACALR